MPTLKSSEKALRVSRSRRSINQVTRNKYKEAVKAVRDFIRAEKKAEAEKALGAAFKQLDKAAKKKVIHKNKAARLKSRLTQAIAKLEK